MELMKQYSDVLTELNKFKMSIQYRKFDFEHFTPTELKAMRYSRGVKPNRLHRIVGLDMEGLLYYEKSSNIEYVPSDIAEKYVVALGITSNEYSRIKKFLTGETNGYEQQRHVPPRIAKQVKERDGYRCTKCGADEKQLHVHHIIKFADGGLHTLDNLTTLCGPCHTKEHVNDQSYYMMKKIYGEG